MRTALRRAVVAALVAGAVASALATATPASAAARPAAADRPRVAVAVGDSYLSGEAGRWFGNATAEGNTGNGTDRARIADGAIDLGQVYVDGTDRSGCHRSDVAPIASSAVALDALVNLACSGARTVHVVSSAAGGEAHRGEPPQADQLAEVASGADVALVAVLIGGNDIGFGSLIRDCVTDFVAAWLWFGSPTCNDVAEAQVGRDLPRVAASVGAALDAVIAAVGGEDAAARVVVLTYPSPVPRSADLRARSSPDKWSQGCPVAHADLDWARDRFVPLLADTLAAEARRRGLEVLDLRDALEGHEVCARTAALVGPGGPDGATAEWARFLRLDGRSGDLAEVFHPNAYGQQAIGRCLALLWSAPPGAGWSCRPTPGAGPAAMQLVERSMVAAATVPRP